MSWIYAFGELGESRYTKVGLAKDHYHDRFSKTQQCNPIPVEIVGTWRFPSSTAARQCEDEVKKGTVFPRWQGGGPEWFRVSPRDIHSNKAFTTLVSKLGGEYHPPLHFSGAFLETLNLGTRDRNGFIYRPHLYLISDAIPEDSTVRVSKLALSAYNWPTVVAHYMTYNPRSLSIAGRWSFSDDVSGKAAIASLVRRCMSRQINPLGWFRIDPDEMAAFISESGSQPYPRVGPIDDRVHYTKFRVPIS